jgi:formate C-acetyltransferase
MNSGDDFIQCNYTPYDLEGPTEATDKLWGKLTGASERRACKRRRSGYGDRSSNGITAYGPGYIDESMKDLEQVVGLQTDKPLKRAFMPYGGIKMAEQPVQDLRIQPK